MSLLLRNMPVPAKFYLPRSASPAEGCPDKAAEMCGPVIGGVFNRAVFWEKLAGFVACRSWIPLVSKGGFFGMYSFNVIMKVPRDRSADRGLSPKLERHLREPIRWSRPSSSLACSPTTHLEQRALSRACSNRLYNHDEHDAVDGQKFALEP